MKLGEALLRRNELVGNIDQLSRRVKNNLVVQEGDEPGESPRVLISKLHKDETALDLLVKQIFYTNSVAMCGSVTMAEAVTHKRVLTKKSEHYESFYQKFDRNSASKLNDKVLSDRDVMNTLSQITSGSSGVGQDGVKTLQNQMKFLGEVKELHKLEATSKQLKKELEELEEQIREATWTTDLIEDCSQVVEDEE